MTPIYSDEDRITIVRRFINARGQGRAPITDFTPIARYLNGKSIKILHKVEPTTVTSHVPLSNYVQYSTYTAKDAEEYFNWLISIVAGAEKASEDTTKEAGDQLFMFIFALRDKMTLNPDVLLMASHDWEDRLVSLEGKYSVLERRSENRNEQITNSLEKLNKWEEKYEPYLDDLKRDRDMMGKALKVKRNGGGKGNDKKGIN